MDFSKFDNRKAADEGRWMQVVDPNTLEPLVSDDGKPCRVKVLGVASHAIQDAQRAVQRAAMKAPKPEDDARVLEDIHDESVKAAAPFIVGFENVERGGKPATAEDAEWFLGLTFPIMTAKIIDGEIKFETKNRTFAKQVTEFASGDDFLG